MPTDDANAARYRPVQHLNGRIVRECCQSAGSRSLALSRVLTKSFYPLEQKLSDEGFKKEDSSTLKITGMNIEKYSHFLPTCSLQPCTTGVGACETSVLEILTFLR